MNQNSLHIEFERLTDLLVGAVSDAEKAQLEAHLRTCPACSMQKTRAEKFIGAMRSDRLEEVPSHILERSFDLLRERKSAPAKPSPLRRILAVLESESSSLTPAFGLRSGQSEAARRFWVTAEDSEIDLQLRQTGENLNITGQIFGSFAGGRAVLESDKAKYETEIGDLGDFTFTDVPVETYKMILYYSDAEIEMPEIRIGG